VNAPAQVTRVDDERTATITAIPSGTDLGGTSAALKTALNTLELPDGVSVRIGGVSQQQQDSFAQLGLAMLVAIGIVYLIMVGTFGSLVQPLILLVSVPFAATGALALLLVTDTPLGIASMIGLLMLIGIVVTNAIVLIDLINQFRRRGASVDDAVMHGARLRLRPIIMTAVATIMALVPMGLGVTGGSVFISKPLAIVVIGGLVSSTVLTLVLVPVLYDLLEKTRARWSERRGTSAPVDESDAEGTLVEP
jgi:HAE1 family hydrophobic/amphiphilic exporter-1